MYPWTNCRSLRRTWWAPQFWNWKMPSSAFTRDCLWAGTRSSGSSVWENTRGARPQLKTILYLHSRPRTDTSYFLVLRSYRSFWRSRSTVRECLQQPSRGLWVWVGSVPSSACSMCHLVFVGKILWILLYPIWNIRIFFYFLKAHFLIFWK